MNYRQIKPGPATSRFVECYWMLEDDSSSPGEVQRIVPDGRTELILNLGTPFESCRHGRWESQPEYFFAGQITGPMLVRPNGPARILGVRFRPQGASFVMGLPVSELTSLVVPLADIAPTLCRQLSCLRELPSTTQQIAFVDSLLQEFADHDGDALVATAVGQFMNTDGELDIANLAAELGLSLRQFERRFKNEVGIGPKLFSRMQRFQRVFRALTIPSPAWVNVAADCGYYDQAHLIRDFRDFSGEPPAALLTAETDLAFHFLQNRPMSHLSKTLGSVPA